jgi:hypothetical protein
MRPRAVTTPAGPICNDRCCQPWGRCMPKKKSLSPPGRLPRRPSTRVRKAAASNFYLEWEPWSDAWGRILEYVKDWQLVCIELGQRLRSGQIKSLIRAIDHRTESVQDQALPREFWEETRIRPMRDDSFGIGLNEWLGKKLSEKALPPWWPSDGSTKYVSYMLYLKRRDVDRHYGKVGVQPHEADRPEARAPEPLPDRRGRVRVHDWHDIDAEIARRCIDPETGRVRVPESESKLVAEMLEWCDKRNRKEPPRSEMHEAVRRICAALRTVQT